MAASAVPSRKPFDLGPMESIGAKGPKATAKAPSRATRSKPSAGSAWAAWQADGLASSRDDFLPSVSSWTEGTAAQLLRPPWPTDVKRPTVMDVEKRLHHHLGLVARGAPTSYLEALELARSGVIEELRLARMQVTPGR